MFVTLTDGQVIERCFGLDNTWRWVHHPEPPQMLQSVLVSLSGQEMYGIGRMGDVLQYAYIGSGTWLLDVNVVALVSLLIFTMDVM